MAGPESALPHLRAPGRQLITIPWSSDALRALASRSANRGGRSIQCLPPPWPCCFSPISDARKRGHCSAAPPACPEGALEWESSFLFVGGVDTPPHQSIVVLRLCTGCGLHCGDRSPGWLKTQDMMDSAVLWVGEEAMVYFSHAPGLPRGPAHTAWH